MFSVCLTSDTTSSTSVSRPWPPSAMAGPSDGGCLSVLPSSSMFTRPNAASVYRTRATSPMNMDAQHYMSLTNHDKAEGSAPCTRT